MPRTSSALKAVLQVSTSDIGGGAERVAMSLHAAYLERGLDAWIAVGNRFGDDPRVLAIDNDRARAGWTRTVTRLLRDRGDSAAIRAALVATDPIRYSKILRGREDYDFPASTHLLDLPPTPPDILHFHNLHGYYFDLRRLPAITSKVPGVITMHDAWLLTGHCAHPFECTKWRTGCGDCPDLGMYVPISRDASARNRHEKFDVLARSDVRLATPSEWLMQLVQHSGAADLVADTRVIPNGVDIEAFAPGDAIEARRALGLPVDRPIVLVAANALKLNPFKDYSTLIAALPILGVRSPDAMVVALGALEGDFPDAGIEVRPAPFVTDREQMARYYRAADVYAHPARAENLPLTLIEASACGTAAVASAVGGVGEVIADGITGDLVPVGDADRLAGTIAELLGDDERRHAYSLAARRRAVARFSLERQADAYVSWFEEIVSTRPGPPPRRA